MLEPEISCNTISNGGGGNLIYTDAYNIILLIIIINEDYTPRIRVSDSQSRLVNGITINNED